MIAVIFANWSELKDIKSYVRVTEKGTWNDLHFFRGDIAGKPILLARTGAGIRRARNGTKYVIQRFKPRLIISAGLAGALGEGLRVGDIIVGEWVLSLKRRQKKMLFSDVGLFSTDFTQGGLLTEGRFVHNPAEKRQLYGETGALSVDMETWGVAEAAHDYGLSVISVRSISDDTRAELPDTRGFYSSSGELRKLNAFKYLVFNPGLIYPFLRFVLFDIRKSTRRLNIFLKELIENS